MTIDLKTENRSEIGKLDALRESGFVPCVYYGHKKESTPLKIKKVDFIKAWKSAGESSVITLKTENGDLDALIHSVDLHPITGEPIHADFYVFEKGHKIEISIPLEFQGVSPAIKDLGGILTKVMHEIKIKADPSNLPHEILVDISTLINLDSQILASEITLPKGVELMENLDEVVASISVPKEEVVETAPIDLSQIEVEKKGKKDEETAEAESN